MYQSFIGLEVHIHLKTARKVFCSCRAAFGDEPNTNICPICTGQPGVLPELNPEALWMGGLVARALNCRIPNRTWFERKQYFYPDMPKNYQISQFASPLGQEGYLDIDVGGKSKRIRIKECHLEEDAGKMIHAGNVSLIDYNRAGTALLEIVTQPDMETGEEAEEFIQSLRRLVRYLGVCDGNMEEGSLRADANVSVNRQGAGLGKKVEIKNLNSSRFVRLALDYEIERQKALLEEGKPVRQETRLWNENRDQTEPMRSKENAQDYRYFPEPDIPPITFDEGFYRSLEDALIESPRDRRMRLQKEWGLSFEQADFITQERALAEYYEEAVGAIQAVFDPSGEKKGAIPSVPSPEGQPQKKGDAVPSSALTTAELARRIALWLSSDVKRIINRDGVVLEDLSRWALTPARLAQLVYLVADEKVSTKNAKETLELVVKEDRDPLEIIQEKGWERIKDRSRIRSYVEQVFTQEGTTVQDARDAQRAENRKRYETLVAYLVGKVLAASGGRCDGTLTKEEVERCLQEDGSCVS
ncbi:MAG TPA: Asp-tRNA(Asn)/Glu-tRNA(Gln) amidotransferase subunit GatB [Termitinemataceae bacterium]|nr:Asp-tRNA(Asn)/Glu-tRNA(Gln) amidotransferase subunit GatB [Termitinemataceae bacterium]HOM23844.1 Asp-tRNA(Asn)/Glu-tRNA(Gln) amidotransferase subunit GatB [Termitinemataceae bacterium]HPP99892.1 Asp-tRNA(Asn)/Glu-tRNA(Gln) amidotransferase subunit GatB [Termitinemataceae bacterium]